MNTSRKIICLSVAAALTGWSAGASASGFQLLEQNASGLGNAYAGQAAVAEDASTVFFNPAGMSRLRGKQFVIGINAIQPSAKFSNSASVAAAFQTLGGNGGDGGSLAWVPDAYFTMELTPKLNVGVGVNAPFGLKTEYDAAWAGRFYAIKSDLKTYNINPSISYKVTDTVAIGAGVNYQHATAELTNGTNYSAAAFSAGGAALLAAIGGPGVQGVAKLTGSDSAWGFNLGALIQATPDTRVGVTYRSAINYTLAGNVSFSNRPALLGAAIPDGGATANLKIPAIASVAVFSKINPKWDVMADLSWTQWSSFQNLTVVRSSGVQLSNTPENWRDTWRVGIGVTHHYNNAWSSRLGVAYDKSPVPDAYRTPRIPDNDRTWLALGGQYKVSKQGAIDFGYAHLWVKNSPINLPAPNYAANAAASSGMLVGNYSNDVNIISVQYSQAF